MDMHVISLQSPRSHSAARAIAQSHQRNAIAPHKAAGGYELPACTHSGPHVGFVSAASTVAQRQAADSTGHPSIARTMTVNKVANRRGNSDRHAQLVPTFREAESAAWRVITRVKSDGILKLE